MRSKFLSLVLALSMIFSLSITAFAADGDTEATKISVTLQVVNEDGSNFEVKDIEVPEGSSIYTLLTKYNRENNDDPESAELWTVTGSTYGNSWFMDSMSYGDQTYATEPSDKAPAGSGIKDDAWYQGYGLISADPENNVYNYLYAGYAWTYDVEGELEDQDVNVLALNQFVLREGNEVTLTYKLQTSTWTADKPYTNVYPYLPVNP